MRGHLGAQHIAAGQADAAARTAIQALPEVHFASESAGAYHAHKHAHDLPAVEQTGDEVADYLAALRRTIASPTSQSTSAAQLEAARSHAFTRVVDIPAAPGATGRAARGQRFTMTAIVTETADGAVSVATLLVNKGTMR